jgi:T5SS/PEP-CTERM-associated repeat protein
VFRPDSARCRQLKKGRNQMKCSLSPLIVSVVAFCVVGQLSVVRAAFTTSGAIDPATDPSTWTSSTDAHIGYGSDGSLTVDDGSDLVSGYGSVGDNPATATGVVAVAGTGSTWTIDNSLYLGYLGKGTLSISDGGVVTSESGFLGHDSSSMGTVTVVGGGSQWINTYDSYVGFYGSGLLRIADGGVASTDSVLIGYASGFGSGTVTVDGAGSMWTSNRLDVGFFGTGTLAITNGGTATTGPSNIGSGTHALTSGTGTVAVDGGGSTWTTGDLFIGTYGSGTLAITNGGKVSSTFGGIAADRYARGLVAVKGAGSAWTINSGDLYVGSIGKGTLSIVGGGTVSAPNTSLDYTGLLSIDVGNGSLLDVGGGTISSYGTIRILAGARPAANETYAPISAATWIDPVGSYQPVGGTWDNLNHRFTTSIVTSAASGEEVLLNLKEEQRVLVTDAGPGKSGWLVGASFLATILPTSLDFTATAMDGALDALKGQLNPGDVVLGAWSFEAINYYSPDNPLYLSFYVDAFSAPETLQAWQYDGSAWNKYAAADLYYDGTYANFTVTGMGGYAVTGVPEPSTLVYVSVAGLLGSLACVWRKR